MKHNVFFALLIVLLSLNTLTASANNAEVEAIKKLIIEDNKAVEQFDLEKSFEFRADHRHVAIFSNDSLFVGFETIKTRIKKRFAQSKQFVKEIKISVSNIDVEVFGNAASATYDYEGKIVLNNDLENTVTGKMLHYFIKNNGAWQIAFGGSYEIKSSIAENPIEQKLNEMGYQFLSKNEVDKAIEIFKTNVFLFPESANTFDSLGEAYMIKGNKQLAIENYEKSLQLNPQNKNAEMKLNELKN